MTRKNMYRYKTQIEIESDADVSKNKTMNHNKRRVMIRITSKIVFGCTEKQEVRDS